MSYEHVSALPRVHIARQRNMCLGEELFGVDTDELFAYSSPKVVRIKDRRLGILKYSFSILIFFYIVGYNIFWNLGWAKMTVPEGMVRFSLQSPTINTVTKRTRCGFETPNCQSDFTPWEQLPYCRSTYVKPLPCITLDSYSSSWVNPNSFKVATRMEETDDEVNCVPNATTVCSKLWKKAVGNTQPLNKSYVADVDRYSVLIQHAIDVKGVNSRLLKGTLVSKNKALCDSLEEARKESNTGRVRNLPPGEEGVCQIKPHDSYDCEETGENCGFDVFDLKVLMQAAETSERMNPLDGPKPSRYDGLTIAMDVYYTNIPEGSLFPTMDSSPLRKTYTYVVRKIGGAKTEWTNTEVGFDNYKRRKVKTYRGINVVATVRGSWYEFDITTLLIQMTTSLALFALANTLVEAVMLKLLPLRGVYSTMKIQDTKDFSVLQQELDQMSAKTKAALTYDDIETMMEKYTSEEEAVSCEDISVGVIDRGRGVEMRRSFGSHPIARSGSHA